jgi:hypothetical protein
VSERRDEDGVLTIRDHFTIWRKNFRSAYQLNTQNDVAFETELHTHVSTNNIQNIISPFDSL